MPGSKGGGVGGVGGDGSGKDVLSLGS
jgi:hypothetical protein